MSSNFFGGFNNYQEYLQSVHWQRLRSKYILRNSSAKCFICQVSNTLLLHHENYDNLGHERINKDIRVVCHKCHELIHFFTVLGLFKFKVPLNKRHLARRLYYLKFKYCIQSHQYWRCPWYLTISIFS